ncbi:hypothetical protein AB0944_35380, partial [Streptomyces sp. NPDC048399]
MIQIHRTPWAHSTEVTAAIAPGDRQRTNSGPDRPPFFPRSREARHPSAPGPLDAQEAAVFLERARACVDPELRGAIDSL